MIDITEKKLLCIQIFRQGEVKYSWIKLKLDFIDKYV